MNGCRARCLFDVRKVFSRARIFLDRIFCSRIISRFFCNRVFRHRVFDVARFRKFNASFAASTSRSSSSASATTRSTASTSGLIGTGARCARIARRWRAFRCWRARTSRVNSRPRRPGSACFQAPRRHCKWQIMKWLIAISQRFNKIAKQNIMACIAIFCCCAWNFFWFCWQ
ncbi:hypothetical protein MADP06_00774 [Mycoplasma anatis]|nr:hypothetical protein [Mycoplasmopsis anatis]MBW0604487.1 hypothetical protein [Mycoplasmopsis anatis]